MKNKLLLVFSLLLGLCSCQNNNNESSSLIENEPKNVDVIILAGQSNAEGHSLSDYLLGQIDDDLKEKVLNGFDNTYIRYKCGSYGTTYTSGNYNRTYQKVSIGQGGNVSRFGPEIGMAKYFDENQEILNKEIYIIKYAVGGTSIYKDWRSPSSANLVDKTGQLYETLLHFTDEALTQLKKKDLIPTIKAICWMQGESDGIANTYETLEENFINDLLEEFSIYAPGDGKIKFVDAGISQSPAWPYYQTINNAKKANQAKDSDNRVYIDTINEGLTYDLEPEVNPDICHYDSLSMLKLGELFAKTLVEYGFI